jgi:chromosome segregation ATPase
MNPGELSQLRRQQDLVLMGFLEKSVDALTARLTGMETVMVEIRSQCAAMQTALAGSKESYEQMNVRLDYHDKRIGSLEQSVAGLKAWILIVGGLTGIASFLAIVLK